MKIIIVLIFCIFCPPLTTQDDAGVKNKIICNIAGGVWRSTYVFDISILPERCDIINIGQYAFDRDNKVDTHMKESDKDIIRSLLKANKPVYTRIGFDYTEDWGSIFNPPDANVFQTEKFDPLVNFLNKFKVNGLLINYANIYDIATEYVALKISDFVCEIKKKVDKLIVGLIFSGSYYESFTNNSLFDFTITNKVLDLYIIDWSLLNYCEKGTVKTGISPVTSTNPDITTIEQVTTGITNSCMDKSKIYGMVQIVPVIPENLLPKDATHAITTYSIGVQAKKFYAGIVLEQLDTDDYESKCECGPFPVANIAIDGWTGSPFKACPKLDQN